MFRFKNTNARNTRTLPVYDSETMRDVLARAAQIETETQADAPMTAAQIETLGRELGLSSDAVRRSLGEKVGTVAPVARHTTRQETMKAVLPIGLLAYLGFPLLYVISALLRPLETSAVDDFVAATALYGVVRPGWFLPTPRSIVLGAVFLPAMYMVTVLAFCAASGGAASWDLVEIILPMLAITGAFVAMIGGVFRGWWDKLPRNAASNR